MRQHWIVPSAKPQSSVMKSRRPNLHVYVDESKFRDYILVAVQLDSSQLAIARRVVRNLRARSQTHIHMQRERTQRKKLILDAFATIEMKIVVYRARKTRSSELQRREACLRRLITDAVHSGVTRICLDRDETLITFDRRVFIESLRGVPRNSRPEYWHDAGNSELLLALPDAFAWAWARGREWRDTCNQFAVSEVIVDD